jgi:hypothetical protein
MARTPDWSAQVSAARITHAAIDVASVRCIWYGSFGNAEGRCVLVRESGSTKPYDMALYTLDTDTDDVGIVQRYAVRWSIEPSNAAGKQQMGVGQARNRLPKAVQRTVPFGMLVQSLVIVWYAVSGYHPRRCRRPAGGRARWVCAGGRPEGRSLRDRSDAGKVSPGSIGGSLSVTTVVYGPPMLLSSHPEVT